jgi:transcriptional regulator with XRE-family HTH domain
MDWKEHKKRLLKDPEFKKEYKALEPEYKLAAALIRLRLAKGLTQEQLAKLLNTKQESIARLESGGSLPSLSTVKRVADALDAELEINLRPKSQHPEGDAVGAAKK